MTHMVTGLVSVSRAEEAWGLKPVAALEPIFKGKSKVI